MVTSGTVDRRVAKKPGEVALVGKVPMMTPTRRTTRCRRRRTARGARSGDRRDAGKPTGVRTYRAETTRRPATAERDARTAPVEASARVGNAGAADARTPGAATPLRETRAGAGPARTAPAARVADMADIRARSNSMRGVGCDRSSREWRGDEASARSGAQSVAGGWTFSGAGDDASQEREGRPPLIGWTFVWAERTVCEPWKFYTKRTHARISHRNRRRTRRGGCDDGVRSVLPLRNDRLLTLLGAAPRRGALRATQRRPPTRIARRETTARARCPRAPRRPSAGWRKPASAPARTTPRATPRPVP